MGMESKPLTRKSFSWVLHIKDATRKAVSSPSRYVMHGFWSREEITENGRPEKHKASSDTPAVADQGNRHPCCHESVAESGQTASTVHLWFIFSCVVFSLVSGALCLALLLLRRRLHRRPQLCSPVFIPGTSSVYLLWFTHPPSLDMDCRHCPYAPTAFLSTAACLQI